MRRYIFFVLCSLFLLSVFCGCNISQIQPQESIPVITEVTATTPSDPQSAPTVPEESNPPMQTNPQNQTVENLVYDGITETFRWEDGVGNQNEFYITIPSLAGDYSAAGEFNSRMRDFAAPLLAEAKDCKENGYSSMWNRVFYEAYLNGEFLSVVLIQETTVDIVYYDVYNFDVEDLEPIGIAELCDDALDLTYPQFLKATEQWILQQFDAKYSQYKEINPEEYGQILDLITDDTVSMYYTSLYFGENGKLMLVYDAPSMAGAMYYPTVTELTPGMLPDISETDAWTWFFGLSRKVDGAYATGYENLLKIAFSDDPDDFSEALSLLDADHRAQIVAFLRSAFADQEDTLTWLCEDIDNQNMKHEILSGLVK